MLRVSHSTPRARLREGGGDDGKAVLTQKEVAEDDLESLFYLMGRNVIYFCK